MRFEERFLAIETSCDDTCAAVLDGRGNILSSVVSSQGIHQEYLGVVPELASRAHLDLLTPAIQQACDAAATPLEEMAAVAVTRGPGLIGCLLVGLATAKGLAYALDRPLIGVNHIEGHLRAILGVRPFEPPFVALVASGGHTELVHAETWEECAVLGATRDDAAGEAFDKVAKLLELGFPGGPLIDRLSEHGDARAVDLPRAWLGLESGNLDFSFSGLKTAVRQVVEAGPRAGEGAARERFVADVAASFQRAVVDVLVGKLRKACELTGTRRVLLSGGVACNRSLRAATAAMAQEIGGEAAWPTPALCADNAAMIGLAALPRLLRGERDGLDLSAVANLDDLPWGGVRTLA